jgi:hypothetical protein
VSYVTLYLPVSYGDENTSRQLFEKELTTDFLPRVGDLVELVKSEDDMLLPVQKLYWSERGVPRLEFPQVIVKPKDTIPSRTYQTFVFRDHEEFIASLEKHGWYDA